MADDSPNTQRKQQLLEFYLGLTPEEKQRRVALEPAFRDAYNEITQADRFSPVPWYFWAKWAPRLNPLLTVVYLKLRQYVFFNRQTGERREIVWPRQDRLAEEIGSNRKSVMKALHELEDLGFLSSVKGRRNEPTTGQLVNSTKKYRVFFELPLIPEDAVELLMREIELEKGGAERRESQIGTFGTRPVENPPRKSLIGTSLAVPNRDSRTNTRTSTSTLTNVDSRNSGNMGEVDAAAPEVRRMADASRMAGAALALEVGDTLHRMAGQSGLGPHPSAGFHRRVCRLMPAHLVREALAATRDAVERARGGERPLRKGPGAYFAGAVKALAKAHGIDLGLRTPDPASRTPRKAPGCLATRVSGRGEGKPLDDPPMSPEKAREALRELVERLGAANAGGRD